MKVTGTYPVFQLEYTHVNGDEAWYIWENNYRERLAFRRRGGTRRRVLGRLATWFHRRRAA